MVGAAAVRGGGFYTGLEWVGPCIGINWIVPWQLHCVVDDELSCLLEGMVFLILFASLAPLSLLLPNQVYKSCVPLLPVINTTPSKQDIHINTSFLQKSHRLAQACNVSVCYQHYTLRTQHLCIVVIGADICSMGC